MIHWFVLGWFTLGILMMPFLKNRPRDCFWMLGETVDYIIIVAYVVYIMVTNGSFN